MDGQPVDPSKWNQENPYVPVLKKMNSTGKWEALDWNKIYEYNDDWRIFARSASDAKGLFQCFWQQLMQLMKMGSPPTLI